MPLSDAAIDVALAVNSHFFVFLFRILFSHSTQPIANCQLIAPLAGTYSHYYHLASPRAWHARAELQKQKLDQLGHTSDGLGRLFYTDTSHATKMTR